MIERMLTVGGFTLLSRITGFVRDIVLAAILGAGPVADAFFVALRLPNHFRAIFAEGAFNAAFVPAYARIREQGGATRAGLFADRIFTLLLASQIVLLAVALAVHAGGDRCAGAGLRARSGALRARGRSHPHHLSLSAAGHAGHALWRHPQCAAALRRRRRGADPAQSLARGRARAGGILSDRRPCRGLGRAGRRCPRIPAGRRRRDPRRRAWPRCAGRNSTPMCGNSSARSGRRRSAPPACSSRCSPTPSSRASCRPARCPRSTTPTASISSRSASSASPPAPSSCRKWRGASPPATKPARRNAQNRAIEFTLLLSIPCLAAFFVIPELIMRALFMRGAFTAADAVAAGRTLAAYAFGLLPFVLIRSTVATFFARGDTATPVKAALIAAAVNIALQVPADGPAGAGGPRAGDLDRRLDQSRPGGLVCDARRSRPDRRAPAAIDDQAGGRRPRAGRLRCGYATAPVAHLFEGWHRLRDVATLALLAAIGGGVYGGIVIGAVRPRAGWRHFAPARRG